MVKPRGPVCNLACDYCYYLPKTNLYPNSDFRMSHDLLANFTRQMLSAQPGSQVTFAWQGGEPTLMGLEFFQEAVRIQKEAAPHGMQVSNVIQTNGLTLTPAWCRFFKEHDFLVGMSLDGPLGMHNTYRRNEAGVGSFTQAARAVDLLKQHEVDFNILCCVHRANQAYPLDVYHFFRDVLEVNYLQFIPILQRTLDSKGRETEEISELSVQSTAYGHFLQTIFDEWVKKDVGRVFVQIFDIALGAWLGAPPSLCVFAETCGRALVLEHNGDLYACDHFVNNEHLLGNITHHPLADMVNSKPQEEFGLNKKTSVSPTCLDCPVWFVCHGGCPKNRDVNGLNHLCSGYKIFFEHIKPAMEKMADLIRHGQTPAEIMKV
ncbi:MAG: anaerobic sulfatase maturase [Brevefilum sp.]